MAPSPLEAVAVVASAQWGLFTTEQALKAGFTKDALRWACRANGPFERVLNGVYRLRDFCPPALQALGAVLLARGEGTVACRRSAGWALGLDGVEAGTIEVAVPPIRSHHRSGTRRIVNRDRVVPLGPFWMTDPVTTLMDLADVLDDITWEWTLESGLRKQLFSADAVAAESDHRSHLRKPGAARARRVLALRPAGARPTGSQLETEFTQLIRPVAEIPEPERQFPVVRHGRIVARLDAAFPQARAYTEVHGGQHRESLQYDSNRETIVALTLGWLTSEVTSRDIRKTPKPTIARMVEFIATASGRH